MRRFLLGKGHLRTLCPPLSGAMPLRKTSLHDLCKLLRLPQFGLENDPGKARKTLVAAQRASRARAYKICVQLGHTHRRSHLRVVAVDPLIHLVKQFGIHQPILPAFQLRRQPKPQPVALRPRTLTLRVHWLQ